MYCKHAEYACKLQTNLSMHNKQCHDMQKNATSYCWDKYAEFTRICQKNMLMISKKTHDQKTMTEYKIRKMQYHLCILPFLEVTMLFNLHVIIMGNTVGKSPTSILSLFYLVLKPLKLQNSWRIFDRPVSSMYCKYAAYACKLQTNLSMNNKQCHDMQKNATSHC